MQVLDEIGINLNASLVSAPGQKVAAAVPAAAVQQPVAQPMGAAEGGGGTAPGLDDDLQARLDRLRKS